MASIAEALSEPDLPYKMDVIDLSTVEPAFRARIAAGWIPFETTKAGE
jgi:hypothetical protein